LVAVPGLRRPCRLPEGRARPGCRRRARARRQRRRLPGAHLRPAKVAPASLASPAARMATDTRTGSATWWSRAHGDADGVLVAYFSMEFGLEARLPIYSGGLGVLAGDHLKAAADLGVPLVGVGLFYRGGYFTQGVSDEGRQTEKYEELDPVALGLVREDVTVEVHLAGETV